MVDQLEFLMSLISIIFHLFNTFRKAISMSSLPLKRLSKHHNDASVSKVHPVPEDSSSSQTQGQIMQPDLLSATRDIRSRLDVSRNNEGCLVDRSMVEIVGLVGVPNHTVAQAKVPSKLRKRPTMIIVPESGMVSGFGDASRELDSVPKEFEVEGSEYCLVSRKGTRHAMEDGYEMITNIHGDPKQAFFGVYDGHGGRAAVDFVCEKLGKNIITGISQIEGEGQIELAIRDGYLATDKEFLSKGLKGGACTATVLLRNGELHASNVGDSRVVISRKGIATALTCDHRAGREDEVVRIESSGGYVTCRNGVTRVHDSLAVSRAIGDANMKEWIISEPETENLCVTPDCEFLIMASDGLWDKVSNQEAVDVVSRHKNSMKSCRELVDISSIRGSRDDITVMVVDLQRFLQMGS